MALIREDGSIVPQHWRNGAWMVTGDQNPLPVENYILNGSVWVPISDTNPLPTKAMNAINIQTQNPLDVNVRNSSINVTASNALPVNVQNANLSVTASSTFPVNIQNSSIPITASNALPVNVQNSSIPVNVQNSSVNVTASSALPVNVQNASVTVTASSALPTKLTAQGYTTHVSIETNATTTETNMSFNVDFIVLISNDGTDSVFFNFDTSTSNAGKITLKAGEVLTDFPRSCTTIYFKANSGSQPIRIWGVK